MHTDVDRALDEFYSTIYDVLNIDWNFLEMHTDVDRALDEFYSTIYKVLHRTVPKCSTAKFSGYPSWFNRSIIANLKLKSYYHRKWRSTGLFAYRKDFSELRRVCKREIASAYSAYLGTIQNSLKTNPKALWSYVESQKGTSRIPGRMRHGDQELDSPRDIVNSFAEEFARAYSGPCNSVSPLLSSDLLSFHIPLISYDTTVKLMATLSNKYTSGDDQLPSFFIQHYFFSRSFVYMSQTAWILPG
ncbi:hypothetical protein QE152_g15364 [Popillia japonica]|uniref:Uncharacterized protein n=1 Tax=Popillia japonica TaxID=7064 RepID=A0AAW1L804_POPJA